MSHIMLWLFFTFLVIKTCDCHVTIGDICTLPSKKLGVCLDISQCGQLIPIIRKGRYPQLCGFLGGAPIFCCNTVFGLKIQQACKKKPSINDFVNELSLIPDIESDIEPDEAPSDEFSYIVPLSYGNHSDKNSLCNGILMTEEFVLTSAHCLHHSKHGKVTSANSQRVINVYKHPRYQVKQDYFDVAILETDRPIFYNNHVKLSCLQVDRISDNQTIFGVTLTRQSTIIKYDLVLLKSTECSKFYADFIDDLQICTKLVRRVPRMLKNDFIQINGFVLANSENDFIRYKIIGVASFYDHIHGIVIYTRLSNYIPWIESIVWP